jgi:hypothetical protein
MQIKAKNVDYIEGTTMFSSATLGTSFNGYCANQEIKGQETSQRCEDIEPCYVNYKNNVQKLVVCP